MEKPKINSYSKDVKREATTDIPLCGHDFETDLANAMYLSLAEEEELNAIVSKYDIPPLDQHQPTSSPSPRHQQEPQRQCPVCDDYLQLSEVELKNHIDQCLDKDDLPSIPNNTCQQIPPWQRVLQSIPTSIQNTLLGKSLLSSPPPPERQQQAASQARQVPSFKWMKDTKFVVDAFSYGKILDCEGYFLTHFHSDHYRGLNKSWTHGPIYCSSITANLVMQRLDVDKDYIRILPMDEPHHVLPNVKVTLVDANHCPGSVLFIFDVQKNGTDACWIRHLHTGDFRANPRMCLHPLLRQPENPIIDHLYLDTTYLNAKYGFPAQEECIQAACEVVQAYITAKMTSDTGISMEQATENLLVIVGSYSIGKEKVFNAIAKLLECKIFVPSTKRSILSCQENYELDKLLTEDQKEANVHVLPLNDIKPENIHAYKKSLAPRFTDVIAFKPTGWTFKPSDNYDSDMEPDNLFQVTKAPADRQLTLTPQHDTPTMKIYGVPYSEHSSFRELASFIASLKINHVVPTVYSESETGQQKAMLYIDKWQQDKQDRPVQVIPYQTESHW
ncbi:DNA repair metallo-beta-lactamase-domain-containing protein [Absidia repens]|uniref:DNA repair metallo-beta-lactamase-domain-containing protein n=1 Tax=Absidia repens TaxID=90262 RepID=A0A1X2IT39_9FUNG|nr:DNA repair metallo-beta-lactamase-domain-containing protein [Absidia repens]